MFLLESVLFGVCILPLVVIALVTNHRGSIFYALLFICLLILDVTLTALPLDYNSLLISGSSWNWTGKIFSICWACIFIKLSPLSYKEVGLTLKQKAGSILPATIITTLVIILSIGLGFVFSGNSSFGLETVIYQLTAPGFAEELTYRGVFLVLLHRALPPQKGNFSFWWPAIITTIAFGLWHGLTFDGWQVSFNFMAFLFPLSGSIAFVWLREKTGSLLFPIIAHNASNAVIFVIGMI